MFAFNQKLRFGLLLMGVVVLMTGCLGLFPSRPPTPTEPTLLQGTLSGPAGLAEGSIDASAVGSPNPLDFVHSFTSWIGGRSVFAATAYISGEGPLPHTPVAVYNLVEFLNSPDDAQVLQYATTDEDGNYSLTGLPTGVDLIVVAATVPRLSAIVPASGNTMAADVNSATALVTEAWAQILRDENQSVSAVELAAAVDDAKQALDALQLGDEALLDALADLIPETFGEGLPTAVPHGFEAVVDVIKSSVPGSQGEPGNGDDICETGGDGTEANPRVLCTAEQLQDIKLNVGHHYELGGHIDASDTSSWNEGAGFEPIGSFAGTLDGKGFTIIGLYIDRPESESVGLFRSIAATGEVRNVGLVDGYVRGKQNVGAIAGRNLGTISDSYNTGEVHGVDGFGPIGGLVGENYGGTFARPAPGLIVNSYNSGQVGTTGFVHTVGGIVGHNHSSGKIEDSYNAGQVGSLDSGGNIGGIVGYMERGDRSGTEVIRSYNDGAVLAGGGDVGGVVGRSNNAVAVRDSYNLGSVTAESGYVGGVVGNNNTGSKVENSYNAGVVTGWGYTGGVVGSNGHGYSGEVSTIAFSWNEGSVEGTNRVGGVAGLNTASAEINNSYNVHHAQVTGNESVGGVVGQNSALVETSYNAGTVRGYTRVGGVVGLNEGAVKTSFNTGAVHGDWTSIGGVVGYHYYSHNSWTSVTYIEDSYNTGPVTGLGQDNEDQKSFHVGGVVGYHGARITNTYNTGSVNGHENVGGLVGERITTSGRGIIESSYFSGGPINDHGSPVSESDLMQESTFQEWDFTSVWTTHGDTDYADLIENPRP